MDEAIKYYKNLSIGVQRIIILLTIFPLTAGIGMGGGYYFWIPAVYWALVLGLFWVLAGFKKKKETVKDELAQMRAELDALTEIAVAHENKIQEIENTLEEL